MTPGQLLFLAAAIFAVAFCIRALVTPAPLGYIAVMSLLRLAPAVIKPTALTLNILVACIGAWQFWRAGFFSWSLFWPFAVLAIPMAFVGGYINLPTHIFRMLVGIVLLFSAGPLLLRPPDDSLAEEPSRPVAVSLGAGLGLLSGLTGTGGGIFLTPLLLFMRWARARTPRQATAAITKMNANEETASCC